MSEVKKFEGKNLDSAIQKACSYFAKDKDNLEINVLDAGSNGIFGLGGRNTIIEAKIKLDPKTLENKIDNVIRKLLKPLINDPQLEIKVNERRIHVIIQDQDNSGLIIGREGHNISALEYLTNLIVAKEWPDKVYIQLDAGGYRTKQDENLKNKAWQLARKAKQSGRTQSTEPLSSYHRRLVHMTLQNENDIITKSKGDGTLKRVLIFKKNKRRKHPRT